MQQALPWYRSVAVKSCLIAFVATHIPLLGLIAMIVLSPQALSPWGVFLVALLFTLLATAFVIGVLWRMFRPLREAADGLQGFMTDGRLFVPSAAGSDEVGRMVQVLVRALAHLERGRAPLLDAGAFAMSSQMAGTEQRGWMVLMEVDQWQALDREGRLDELVQVQKGMAQALEGQLGPDEMMLPWGRGRVLAVLSGRGADVFDRLERLCEQLPIPRTSKLYTATAAVEPREAGPRSWAAGLQRLENKLFALRLRGLQAQVA
ncbi:MAG: hypothetical protein EOO78_05365 [Oxalobacteraceae bacterium]|nr:MAG: hypothetical protein EOO78_05365 [Oxalobacteraceae bacterium]